MHSENPRTSGFSSLVVLVAVLAGVSLLVVLFIFAVTSYFRIAPYAAKTAEETELKRIHLFDQPPSSQEYEPGICLDNCPTLRATYHISPIALGEEREQLVKRLQAPGYSPINVVSADGMSLYLEDKANSCSITIALDAGAPVITEPDGSSYTNPLTDSSTITEVGVYIRQP
jgi:hypothetical protein